MGCDDVRCHRLIYMGVYGMSEVKLYLGDCLEVMKSIPDKSVDAVITDPPYGIGINKSNRLSVSRGFGDDVWDSERVIEHMGFIADKFGCKDMVVWGGNYYADVLPISRGWLIWDKVNKGRDFGEAELAWTNHDSVIRKYEKFPVNMDGGKLHPTQKPIEVIKWCMEYLELSDDTTILDPFMGSGTTGVACVQTGRNFIGIEIDPTYYAIAEKRIKDAQQQMRLPI